MGIRCDVALAFDHEVRDGEVVEVCRQSERFQRVVLCVPELGELQLPAAADAAVGMYFGGSDAQGRTYTIRACDR